MSEPPELIAVDMRGISKRFPGVVANDQVDFEVGRARFTPCWARMGPARAR
jgi:ABC-type sugar transport system ATPase subunit